MEQAAKPIDPKSSKLATNLARKRLSDYLERARKVEADEDKQQRLAKLSCKVCWYLQDRIGGAAITKRPCGLCHGEMMFSSTDTDVLCPDCASAHELCRHCGGDLHLRERRKLPWPGSQ